jgi:hypothetical protein
MFTRNLLEIKGYHRVYIGTTQQSRNISQLSEYKTFRVPKDSDDLSTYQQIPYHMVFDCKFDGRRKGRLVAGGNHTIVTSEQVYSDVVGIETVRTVLALSGKNIERTMIKAGPEFGAL